MARAENRDLVDSFEQFYRRYYTDEVGELARNYPREQKSLYLDWTDLYTFDPDIAEEYLSKPQQYRECAEEALRLYDLPVDVSLGQAHVRLRNLDSHTDIRAIRSRHVGRLVSAQGMVRKATDVRPKVQEAAFECQRCGTLTRIPQSGGEFQEPHECQGCERQGPFQVNFDQSEFIDSQKLRIQESPEGLRGGETPQSIDVNIEDDITGEVTPGDHVTVTGVLELDQQESGQEKSPVFDVYMDGQSVEIEDEEFEDMDITDEDKADIIELSENGDIYQRMVDSIAPNIYGHEQAKLAMMLQLFSGVTKHLPDGSRTRGDLHMLLIGDPGTGKSQMLQYVQNIAPRSVYTSGKGSSAAGLCVTGDTKIHTDDGFVPIRELAAEKHPEPVNTETAALASHDLYTYDEDTGRVDRTESSLVWRMPEKPCRRIETAHGKELEASVNTPILVCGEHGIEWREISEIRAGDHVAVPDHTDIERSSPSPMGFFEFTGEKLKPDAESASLLVDALREEFGTLRDAAATLDLSEDFLYDSLRNRHLPQDKLDTVLDAVDAERSDLRFERAMLRHGGGVSLPDEFDADLMYLVGLVFGDGDVMVSRRGGNRGYVRISNGDEELLETAADIMAEKFDKRPDIEYQDERVPCIRLHSATVARFFSNLGVESPKEDIALDPQLTTAEHADAFLRGLFDADGSVCPRDNGGSSVQFSTVCGRLAEQVQLMLETYGVRSRTRERDRRGTYEREDGHEIESTSVQTHLAIYGTELDAYAERIGFRSSAKAEALDTVVGGSPRTGERLPLGDTLLRADGAGGAFHNNITRGSNPSRARAREILDSRNLGTVESAVEEVVEADLVWDEVTAATDTGEKEVFDLTVPDTHNFVGNGVVTHNTAAAVRDDFGDGQQWTLEAGALVLADQGIAAVDELDKMRCVTSDTLVHLGDGRIERIGELAREAAKDGEIEELPNGQTIRNLDLTAWTMDDNDVVCRDITAIHEYDAPESLSEVTLETGESLTATDDHPFFVFEDGERVERGAAELEPGDWVYVPRSVPRAAGDGGVETLPASDWPDDVIGPEMGAVLGYLSGDGNVRTDEQGHPRGIRFTNTEEELLADFERCASIAFSGDPYRPPSEQRADGVETVRLDGTEDTERVIEAGMNTEVYDGKAFPTSVTRGSPETKAAFARALADSEGCVDTTTGNVAIASASRELLTGTKELLLEFGISTQIQTRVHENKRDLYNLVITDAASLRAFHEHVGFTLDRKRAALAAVVETVDGDRTVLDVLPGVNDVLQTCRESLRLHQSECGIPAGTYADFETGRANVSLHRVRLVLDAFRARKQLAAEDAETIGRGSSWEALEATKERYHVSQHELAAGTEYSQQQISSGWGESETLRETVGTRLQTLLTEIAAVDLEALSSLVYGDVKWRRVESVDSVEAKARTDRAEPYRRELASVLGCSPDEAVERARTLIEADAPLGTPEEISTTLREHGISHRTIAAELGVDQSTVTRWINDSVETDRFDELREVAKDCLRATRGEVRDLINEIESRQTPKVYDLTVEGTHNFIANGMVVHNSEDQSAMHEALEQQEISVAKAGINATLKSRCSLLGAANPTYGRFDQYEPIGEQIDLDPPLISRFDLIFTVTDKPDEEEDRRLAEHILRTNYAGELNTHRTKMTSSNVKEEEVDAVVEDVAPDIDAEFLRKYIAYSRRNCFPTMTDEAKQAIEDFYVDLRSQGAGEDAPVPVTARKLEALVRLAEASARVRLSDAVEKSDADRVIEIVRSCLMDIGVDPETGEFDADVVETGTSKTQRDRIRGIKEIVGDLQNEYDEGAPVEKILDEAEQNGMERSKAEHEIEKLKQQGELYQPNQDHLRTL